MHDKAWGVRANDRFDKCNSLDFCTIVSSVPYNLKHYMFAQAAGAREDTPGEESDVEIVAFNDVPKPSKNIDALRMQLIKLQAQLSEKMSKRF